MSSDKIDWMRYQAQHKLVHFAGSWRYSYDIIGRWGAVSLNVTDIGERDDGLNRYSAGLEVHYANPPAGMNDYAPSNAPCIIIGRPCWHSGTTDYAERIWLPRWERLREDPRELLRQLVHEYQERFEVSA